MSSWLKNWNPEDKTFWENEGSKIAWKTLWVTTIALIFSFASWFMMSAIVTKLPSIGFTFTQNQLFWLAAMPGLAGGTLRVIHTFLIPIYGTRMTLTISTFIKLLPVIGIGLAVMDPATPFWVFMVLAFTAGFGGGDFSSYMPSTNMFFPKRLKGTALGIQAGIGNFGVSLAQFMTPVMFGVAMFGSSQISTTIDSKEVAAAFKEMDSTRIVTVFNNLDTAVQTRIIAAFDSKKRDSVKATLNSPDKATLFYKMPAKAKALGKIHPKAAEKVLTAYDAAGVKNKDIYTQSAAFWYIPFLLIMTVVCWFTLRSVPVTASFREQLDIFKEKHTWYCTITYMMTFGTFAGLSAAFPMMIKALYGNFPDAPDPLVYAFYGPLIGSTSRVLFGFVADKTGGAILTTITGLGLIAGTCMLVLMGLVAPVSMDSFPMFVAVMLGMFFFAGIGNAATFRQYPIVFQHNPRQAAGVIGWTGAVAAYGPFIFSMLIGSAIGASGNANMFFWGLLVFLVIATVVNWHFYNRKGCERPS
ncbi:MAG: MFS transporter [Bacteroidia bacterium]|nr:MFS transporter [Bacteroidia bacterium]